MAMHANSTITCRRGFLHALAALPLIGGGLKLIGSPSAAALPISADLLRRYVGFVNRELFAAHVELTLVQSPHHFVNMGFSLADASTWRNLPVWWPVPADADLDSLVTSSPASSRAAVVLAAAGLSPRAGTL